MDSKKAEALRKKYWEGTTSSEEENQLKNQLGSGNHHNDPEEEYFRFLKNEKLEEPLDQNFDDEFMQMVRQQDSGTRQIKINRYWMAAAAVAAILSIGIIFNQGSFKSSPTETAELVDTYEDPQQAFEETKKALMFLSAKLNQGSDYAAEFSKFEASQKQLKQN